MKPSPPYWMRWGLLSFMGGLFAGGLLSPQCGDGLRRRPFEPRVMRYSGDSLTRASAQGFGVDWNRYPGLVGDGDVPAFTTRTRLADGDSPDAAEATAADGASRRRKKKTFLCFVFFC